MILECGIPFENVRLCGGFLGRYYRLACDAIIPYQWDALNDRVGDAKKSHSIRNIEIAAGMKDGEFYGFLFQDSDAAKWLEAVAYCLQNGECAEYEAAADEVIAAIAAAQQDDGYFNTYFQLTAPERKLTNLYEAHELYCLGHLIEAAVAYERATGKRELLDVVIRFTDLINRRFGNGDGKQRGCPGHQEIELALVKLFENTKDVKYLELARFFIDERGSEPNYFAHEWQQRGGYSEWTKREEKRPADFSYNQAHKPVREQTEAVGHAVRAVYMYTAMAEIGRLTGDASLLKACRVLFKSICRQMYVTGGIGSTNHGEAFTFSYDLPNEINYSETCASIGLVFFMHSMLKAEPDAVYADVMERALYNTVASAVGIDGRSFFYVNPMEAVPEASAGNPARAHVKVRREKWHACACCPPNAARLLASIGKYLYTGDGNTIYFHLYEASAASVELDSGTLDFSVQTGYPLDGKVKVIIDSDAADSTTLAFRVPGWCDHAAFRLGGAPVETPAENGYIKITRKFTCGDVIEIDFDMRPRIVYAHSKIRACAGEVCLQRGPLVYCLEECDNSRGLHTVLIDTAADIKEYTGDIGGVPCVMLAASGFIEESADDSEYTFSPGKRSVGELTFIPYNLWGNRTPGEMLVWVRI